MKEGPASRDKVSAVALCKAINGLSSRWKVEEIGWRKDLLESCLGKPEAPVRAQRRCEALNFWIDRKAARTNNSNQKRYRSERNARLRFDAQQVSGI